MSFREVLEREAGYCPANHRRGECCPECAEKALDIWASDRLFAAKDLIRKGRGKEYFKQLQLDALELVDL